MTRSGMMRTRPYGWRPPGRRFRFCSASICALPSVAGAAGTPMRWVLFAVALYVVVVLQTAVMPFLSLHSIRPDLPALLAIHIALAGPSLDALIAAWFVGLVVDLNGASFGAHANVG